MVCSEYLLAHPDVHQLGLGELAKSLAPLVHRGRVFPGRLLPTVIELNLAQADEAFNL